MGLKPEKWISFYTTTYNSGDSEIDTLKTVTLGEMADLPPERFSEFVRQADDDLGGIVLAG